MSELGYVYRTPERAHGVLVILYYIHKFLSQLALLHQTVETNLEDVYSNSEEY
jgi:hypothetical protein